MTTLPALRDRHPQAFGSKDGGNIGMLYIYKKQVEGEERNSNWVTIIEKKRKRRQDKETREWLK